MNAYLLFILLNATLFIRPAEIIPDLAGLPIYLCLILACAALTYPLLIAQLSARSLARDPVTVCVVGMLAACVLSHLSHLYIWGARMSGTDFAKVLLYYLLLVALLDSAGRMRRFLYWLTSFIVVLTGLALLQYYDAIDIPSLKALERRYYDPVTEQSVVLKQLQSTGIFGDPNDLCLILVVGTMFGLYGLGDRRLGTLRYAWLGPLGLFLFALAMTKSRGGFLALLGGVMALFLARFGWRKALPLAAMVLPAMLALFAGRQTNISTNDDTAQGRIHLWSEGLRLFRQSPVFGIGKGFYADEVGQVAHNSFVNSYTDLGFFGGTCFLGAFYCVLTMLHRFGRHAHLIADPEVRRLRPYLMAAIVGYAVGMLSLSRAYVVPTYMIIGLGTAYIRLASRGVRWPGLGFDMRLAQRLVLASAAMLAATYLFVRVFARWG